MELQEAPAKAETEDKEKIAEEPKQEVKTEEEANPEQYSTLLIPSEDIYTETFHTAKPRQELPGSARLYCAIICLSVICLILFLAVVILGVKLQAKSTVHSGEEKATKNREGPSMEKLCMEHFRKTSDSGEEETENNSKGLSTVRTTLCSEHLKRICAGTKKCLYKWFTIHNSCFILSTLRLSWDQSQSNCTSICGSLAVINSQEIQNFLTEKGTLMYWIGLKRYQSAWKWVDNTMLERSYWTSSPGNGDCGLLRSGGSPESNWLKAACNSAAYFICQLNY